MAGCVEGDPVVPNPTYLGHIKDLFRPEDIQHMALKGIDLSTYAGVKKNALRIFLMTQPTQPPDQIMPPPEAGGQWTSECSQTFKNWITNGCPQGTAAPEPVEPGETPEAPADRVRKNVTSLSDPELETLKTAFNGVMDRDPAAEDSYFYIAGLHGLPQAWCLHHEDRFNPWHRVYLKMFEDALRSVPGCGDVTLPYWDLTVPLPDLFQQPPFKEYKLPQDPGATADPPQPSPPGHYFPYTTQRNTAVQITQNLEDFGVFDDIVTARNQSVWGLSNINGYQDFSIQAHDGGHASIGRTMRDQNVAAYDPVFWFFHCNLDRLWLEWQTKVNATTLAGFENVIVPPGTKDFLTGPPPFNSNPPFQTTPAQSIAFGIAYEPPEAEGDEKMMLENKVGSVDAASAFSIKRSDPVSVRVKDIDRLNIPGTFSVHLLADGEPIAKRAFFQPTSPRDCATCAKLPLVNIDFRVDQEQLFDKTLSVEIEVLGHEDIGARYPLSEAGNPTVNARLLLQDE